MHDTLCCLKLVLFLSLCVAIPVSAQTQETIQLEPMNITEGLGAGVIVVDIGRNYSSADQIFHQINSNNREAFEHYFDIPRREGRIITKRTVSRDDIAARLGRSFIHLPVTLQVSFSVIIGNHIIFVNVDVNILDRDNNRPVFIKSPLFFDIAENVDVGFNRELPTAEDNDEGINSTTIYSLRDSINGLFALNIERGATGVVNRVFLVLNRTLDREARDNYVLYIDASEGNSNPDTATLIVNITVLDICDESPEFPVTRYSSSIEENQSANSVIPGNFAATDADLGETITYQIHQNGVCSYEYENVAPCVDVPDSQVPFQLDRETGELTITRELDREEFAQYEVTIRATDSCGRHSSATVVVTVLNVNDNAPKVTSTSSPNVTEGTAEGFQIYFLHVSDPDYGQPSSNNELRFTFNLYDNSTGVLQETELFHLRQTELILSRSLDREETDHYSLVLNVTDWGMPNRSTLYPLPINVVDINDNSPVFRPVKEVYHVPENTPLFNTIVRVQADDLDSYKTGNGRVSYRLPLNRSFPYQGLFSIDPMGRLMLIRSLDREETGSISVLVEAVDNPTNASGPPRSDFIVVNLVISDINDNAPEIHTPPKTLLRDETYPVNSIIFSIYATDEDPNFRNLTYSMTSSSDLPFQLDPITGNVTLISSLDYDRGQTSYNFTVRASDGDLMTTRQVVLHVRDVNDERCVFNRNGPYVFSVNENSPYNYLVGNVGGSDLDTRSDQLTFNIMSGNTGGDLRIDPATGEIFTTTSLDHDKVKNYTLTVSCSDGPGLFSETTVLIQVFDINDNTPQFVGAPYSFSITERNNVNDLVGTVHADDGDSMGNGIVSYRIIGTVPERARDWFVIHSTSGEIRAARSLDREAKELSNLPRDIVTITVLATDNPSNSEDALSNATSVEVAIRDFNDEPPRFSTRAISITVPENYQVGLEFITRIQATDRDIAPNNIIRYRLHEDTPINTRNLFRIHETTGEISLKSTLDFESMPRHTFDVVADDPNQPNFNDIQTVNIIVTNVSKITFTDFMTAVGLPENTMIGQTVSTFIVTDIHQTPLLVNLPKLVYFIRNLDGSIPDDFDIRNDTSSSRLIVFVSSIIDREATAVGNMDTVTRELNITAIDPDTTENSHGSTSAILRVTIIDINDNHPTFSSLSYTFDIVENNGEGVSLGRVTATDPDFGTNGTLGITYQILDTVPFQIESSGNFRVTEELDREFRSFYAFSVVASDGGSPPMTATTSVRVNVVDENDNFPMFVDGHNVGIHVREDAEVYSIVAHLNVRDLDDGHFGEFNITMGDITSSYFHLETNGSIVLLKPLDRETRDRYFFTALARDGGNQVTQGDITVIVDDVNDNRPIFHGVTTSIVIPENLLPGVSFDGRVTATDRDIGRNGDVRYALGSIEFEKTFCINANEGNISLCKQLECTGGSPVADYKREREYLITIVAYDLGEPRFITTQDIRIVVTPVNEHPPSFDKTFLVVHIDETDESNVEVVAIHAIDRDRDDTISYEVLENGRTSNLFRYDLQRRAIVTNGIINFDLAQTHELELVARDSSDPSNIMTGSTEVLVYVNNINNNPPVFDNDISIPDINYPLVISENTAIGSIIWTVKATDADNSSFAAATYHLKRTDPALPFTIGTITGEIVTNGLLDYEVATSYTLQVVARDTDGKESSSLTITANIGNENDHDPVFTSSQYIFSIIENTPANYFIGQVQASDRDSGSYNQVQYCFINTNLNFQIDPVSGRITSLVQFDRDEGVVQYELTVAATDRGLCSSAARASARVVVRIVDENDNAPVFGESEYLVRISPTQQPSMTLEILSVTDADDGPYAQFSYFIIPAEPGNLPLTISSKGELSLNTIILASYKPSYSYTVQATDQADRRLSSSVPLDIIVETENDHHPTFSPIPSVEVPESTSIGSPIVNVATYANDVDSGRNGKLTFEFVDAYSKYTIDRKSGVVSLREMVDYEGTREYMIHVKAMDDRADVRRTATAAITVTVLPSNEHAPVFMGVPSQLTLSPLPHTKLDLLTIKADDADQGEDGMVRYNITAQFELNNAIDFFSINMKSGILRNQVRITKNSNYRVIVGAYDHGNPLRFSNSAIQINIQAPDSVPAFMISGPIQLSHDETNFTGEVLNGPLITNPRATSIHIVKQTALGQTTPVEAFRINAQGQLRNLVPLDRETTPEYLVIVESRIEVVSGQEISRKSDFLQVTLKVNDINDNVPFFSVTDQSFNESTPVNTLLFTVHAVDSDEGLEGTVMYFIASGNDDQTFRINLTSGEVFLDRPLDREKVSSYDLVIRARDRSTHPNSFEKTVHVTVININDFETTYGGRNFSVGVHEFPYTHPRESIIKVAAIDRDEGAIISYEMKLVTATIHRDLPNVPLSSLRTTFVIDIDTGVVSVGDQSSLDRESVDLYLYRVTARDQTFEAVTYLTINILDVNDNSPVVTIKSDHTKYILEDQPAGLLVPLTLVATDRDSGINGYLRYSLGTDWPPENYFEIHPLTGVIRTTKPVVVTSAVQLFRGTIIVTDHGEVPRQTTLMASIRVTDVNNHPPIFVDGSSITLSVTQNAVPSSKPVHIFNTTDADFSIHRYPRFKIPSYYSKANSNFNVGFMSGKLTLTRSQPDLKTYNFKIHTFNELSCSEFHQGSSISVIINVRPKNIGCPEFTQQSYSINFTEGASNEAISVIQANDPDGDMITYSIIRLSQVPFSLHPHTGVLSPDIILDREDTSMYSLTVQATDDGFPARSCSVSVTVNVLDINDNAPQFDKSMYTKKVKENLPVDSWINLTVVATDPDLASEGRVQYELAADNVPFRVDRNSGRVFVNGNLDFENSGQYTFSIIALDSANPSLHSTAQVTVVLEDVNEFPPVFDSMPTKPIDINVSPLDMTIITLQASDLDGGAQLLYYFGQPDPSSYFSINNRTGEITLRQIDGDSCPDDLPQQLPDNSKFFLINSTVSVTDGENTDSIPVSFQLHNSFCTISHSSAISVDTLVASIITPLLFVLIMVSIAVLIYFCRVQARRKSPPHSTYQGKSETYIFSESEEDDLTLEL